MYPQPYLDYLIQFHVERDYFECHEILEEYWKSAPPQERQPVWVGLIQIAVALYHQRRGNQPGAIKMLTSATSIIKKHHRDIQKLGLDSAQLASMLEERLMEMHNGKPYRSLSLPMSEATLKQAYQEACSRLNHPENRESDMQDSYLLNKHTLRDRSDVLSLRLQQLQMREARRNNDSN
ncbi:DUF309 domain-containing protein [Brevibacillus sp. 179-C9.3 HS]|uniref:DUF309 domain-containing protein n=1 Tax=unclassified Brevibacillus TaxID=2684853 RepID=UPI0039A0A9DD